MTGQKDRSADLMCNFNGRVWKPLQIGVKVKIFDFANDKGGIQLYRSRYINSEIFLLDKHIRHIL